ncbi:MAG: hypothetical protein F4Z31_06845 [Gemmatimonadetes bacterium]|nr:hypothetical protein [Gemmatimonadota bacterium]MYE92622.1 hypothetical protein [Gemmatimonadota bacterium]MYJ11473.1 hypothetical protein [Gemmatimonadota bacterium]
MNRIGRQRHEKGRLIATLALIATIPACDTLLDVQDPDIIEPDQLRTLQGASALYNGAIGEFALAKDGAAGGPGSALGLVQAMGWFSDEFSFGGTPPLIRAMDLREMDPQNASWDQMYQNLHVARVSAEDAASLLQEVSSGADPRIGELYAVSAAVHILMGEAYCGAVPFSRTEPEIEYGTPLSTDQVMDRAIERLNMADQAAGGSAGIANFARVLRGRALLNQGNYAAAAAAVANVPTDFLYETVHSTNSSREENFMYVDNWELDRYSVSNNEGGNGLNFATAGDPRVPTEYVGVSRFDSETPMYRYLKLTSRAAPVETASGNEARMIEAEAQLNAGDFAGWIATINAARGTVGMDPVPDPGSQDARVDLMFRERAFWLFNTGHRLGDLRRLVRQYGRAANSVYPWGPYHKDNLQRGTDLSLVIPGNEANNPNYSLGDCRDGEA